MNDPKAKQAFSFTKGQRLLNSDEFNQVFKTNRFRVSHKFCLILALPNKYHKPRLGLVIAKKNIRSAVQRNRIKRVIRESFRQQQHQLPAIDAIVLARKGLDQLNNPNTAKVMKQLWQSLKHKAEK